MVKTAPPTEVLSGTVGRDPRRPERRGERTLWKALDGALAECSETRAEVRLARARTSVAFDVLDRPEASATLLLDRFPPHVVKGLQPAEVTVRLTVDQVRRFARGELRLPVAVAAGEVAFEGPVRRYLGVDPIIRGKLGCGAARRPTLDAGAEPPLVHEISDALSIEIRGLRKRFANRTVLRGLNLAIPEGTRYVLTGSAGTGKSTVLGHISGALVPEEGEVRVHGRAVGALTRSEFRRLRTDIRVVHDTLFPSMSVFDNVAFPLRQHTDLSDGQISDLVRDELDAVGVLGSGHRRTTEVSDGIRERAAIARAFVLDPQIVVYDEPGRRLDPAQRMELADLLVDRHGATGGTLVVATGDAVLARRIGDYVGVMAGGHVTSAERCAARTRSSS